MMSLFFFHMRGLGEKIIIIEGNNVAINAIICFFSTPPRASREIRDLLTVRVNDHNNSKNTLASLSLMQKF